ncbi:MAG: phosphoribosyl-AMP cyclohydrolase [Faecalibacterium sp.]
MLTLAYMNAETLALTIAEGRTVFRSRSRQEIWRKGETSGNVQRVVSITADCDADALVEVVSGPPATPARRAASSTKCAPRSSSSSAGGACTTSSGRKTSPKEGSCTTYLFEKGKEDPQKVGESAPRSSSRAKRRQRRDHL